MRQVFYKDRTVDDEWHSHKVPQHVFFGFSKRKVCCHAARIQLGSKDLDLARQATPTFPSVHRHRPLRTRSRHGEPWRITGRSIRRRWASEARGDARYELG